MILYAPAKVNLYLKVLGKRPDGYHNIETVFERIALFDKIVLCSNNKMKILCDNPKVPVGRKSFIYKMISLLKKEFGISKGTEIKIFKRIPMASGLGGASSDAASILIGLNKLWKLYLDTPALCEFGGRFGADIPFFITGKSFAMARGKGDEVVPLDWKNKFWHLLISPPIEILSRDVYSVYKRSNRKKRLKFPSNDLEDIVFKKEPIVAQIKNALKDIGLMYSLVSGSGPSVFSLFEKRKEATRAKELLIKRFPIVKDRGWQIFIVSTF